MRSSLIALVIVVAGLGIAAAQTDEATPQTPQTSVQLGPSTIQGCLSGAAGEFTVTDSSGKVYKLKGNADQLSAKVGHQVEVIGRVAEGAAANDSTTAASSASDTPAASATTSSATQAVTLEISSVKDIAEQCSSVPASPTGEATRTPPDQRHSPAPKRLIATAILVPDDETAMPASVQPSLPQSQIW